jgi:hypothetical protein
MISQYKEFIVVGETNNAVGYLLKPYNVSIKRLNG